MVSEDPFGLDKFALVEDVVDCPREPPEMADIDLARMLPVPHDLRRVTGMTRIVRAYIAAPRRNAAKVCRADCTTNEYVSGHISIRADNARYSAEAAGAT